MPGGLFELRRDPITGWWVAVVVDREYDRSRFAMPARPVDDGGICQNCREPGGAGVRVRTLRAHAFPLPHAEQAGRENVRDRAAVPRRGPAEAAGATAGQPA